MIRRVMAPTSARAVNLTDAPLPPGTPTVQPMQIVYVMPNLAQVGSVPADALVTSDGRQIYRTGPARWGQVVAVGRRG